MCICKHTEINYILHIKVYYWQGTFGDVYIPEDFEPPTIQTIAQFSKKSHGVSSGALQVLDAKTLLIPDFTYNGAGKGM